MHANAMKSAAILLTGILLSGVAGAARRVGGQHRPWTSQTKFAHVLDKSPVTAIMGFIFGGVAQLARAEDS